jgi:hypothetical protein
MKILEQKYPKGSFRYQKSDGKYFDETLYNNLKILAKKITDDMTFLGIIFSSTLEVGTGKSVFVTQLGECWSEILMKEMHNVDLKFTKNNIVFRPKELMDRAFQVPKYSFVLVDEWEDAHYWSELGMTLRQFFRKCRQLNLFIIIIIPNFFELPMTYAVNRSIFAIDVKFKGEFERGYFDFYDFESKKELYVKGKKNHNYHVVKPTFSGNFGDGYGIDREEYLKAKEEDFKKYEEKDGEKTKQITEKDFKAKVIRNYLKAKEYFKAKKIFDKDIALLLGVDRRTIIDYKTIMEVVDNTNAGDIVIK